MPKCDYCGLENDGTQTACVECGTPFVELPPTTDQKLGPPLGLGVILQSIGTVIGRVPGQGPHVLVSLGLIFLGAGILVWGCRRYARAKGYPRWLGWLSVIWPGLIILLLLPNRRKQE
jgi:hypothetical protein